jgi:phosphatidylserine/phosphatidylglycerophosphate/cardiolipin synthase-like enzyme
MAERPDLKVRMYLDIPRKAGDTTIEAELVQRFCHAFRKKQWPVGSRLPEIFYDPRSASLDRTSAAALHAKCVIIDKRDLFVSSANFTEAGQSKNIELGLLVTSAKIADRITTFFERLAAGNHLVRAL